MFTTVPLDLEEILHAPEMDSELAVASYLDS